MLIDLSTSLAFSSLTTSTMNSKNVDLQVKLGMNLRVSEILADIGKENMHLLHLPTEYLRQEAKRHALQSVFKRHQIPGPDCFLKERISPKLMDAEYASVLNVCLSATVQSVDGIVREKRSRSRRLSSIVRFFDLVRDLCQRSHRHHSQCRSTA